MQLAFRDTHTITARKGNVFLLEWLVDSREKGEEVAIVERDLDGLENGKEEE